MRISLLYNWLWKQNKHDKCVFIHCSLTLDIFMVYNVYVSYPAAIWFNIRGEIEILNIGIILKVLISLSTWFCFVDIVSVQWAISNIYSNLFKYNLVKNLLNRHNNPIHCISCYNCPHGGLWLQGNFKISWFTLLISTNII